MNRISGFVLFLLSATTLFSQDSTRVKALSEVIISTSRTEKDASTAPRSVTVINAQQIAAANVKTLPELLSQIESIYIAGNGMNPGGNQSVSMRGTNTNQTAILLDGILLNDPSSPNNAFDIGDLTLNSIQRIEIVRGSNSTIFGSGAIGGSINIITKEKGEKPFEAGVDMRYGSDYTVNNAMIRYTDKNGLYASIGLNNILSKGFDATIDTNSKKPIEPRDLDDFNQTDFMGKIGYEKDKFKISLSAKSLEKSGNIDKGAFVNDNNYTLSTRRKIYHLKSQYSINSKIALQGFAAYSFNERTGIDDSSLVSRNPDITDHTYYRGRNSGGNFQSEILGIYRHRYTNLVLGIGQNNERMSMESEFYIVDPNFPYSSKSAYADSATWRSNKYIFANGDYAFTKESLKGLNIAAGLRINANTQYGNTLSYNLAPSYVKNGNTVYLAFSSGFLNPSMNQLYSSDPSTSLEGNKNLKPQSSQSKEVGFKTIVNKKAYFTIAFFNIETTNPVQYVNLWDKNTHADSLTFMDFKGNTYINAGTQVNKGVDFSLNIKASEELSFSLRYSNVKSTVSVNNSNIDTSATKGNHVQLYEGGAFLSSEVEKVQVIRRPSNTFNAIIVYKPAENFSIRFDARYVSSRYDAFYNPALGPFGALDAKYLSGYTLMDFTARYFLTSNISLGLKIDNLFNTQYTEIMGYRTRGTTSFLDFQVKL